MYVVRAQYHTRDLVFYLDYVLIYGVLETIYNKSTMTLPL